MIFAKSFDFVIYLLGFYFRDSKIQMVFKIVKMYTIKFGIKDMISI